jgi:hypothetical protein
MRSSRKPGSPHSTTDRGESSDGPVTRPARDYDAPGFSLDHDGGVITGPDEESVRGFVSLIEQQRARRDRWPRDGREAMTTLAALFPSMRGVPGTDPWNVEMLIEWSNSGAPTSGSIWAARFLLSVWNPSTNWSEFGLPGAGKFDVHEAWSCWDDVHRAAAMKWLERRFGHDREIGRFGVAGGPTSWTRRII